MLKAEFSLRGRILAIAVVPSLVLLAGGVGTAAYLIEQGRHAKSWAYQVGHAMVPGIDFTDAVLDERQLTAFSVAGDRALGADLAAARTRTDTSLATLERTAQPIAAIDQAAQEQVVSTSVQLFVRLPSLRRGVDAGTISTPDAFQFYSQLSQLSARGMDTVAKTAPDAGTSGEESRAHLLWDLMESASSVSALGAPAVLHGTLTPADFSLYARQLGYTRATVAKLSNQLTGEAGALLRALTASPAWRQLIALQDTVFRHGSGDVSTIDPRVWLTDSAQVNQGLFGVFRAQQFYTDAVASEAADRTAHNSLLGGGAALVLAVGAFAGSLWLSDRTILRLKRLRRDALAAADERLPAIMGRIRAGETVDLDTELSYLEHGRDEIGEVGEAFNRAQLAAVSAAVTEAKTKAGVRAVFLNIAHRSQLVVHRQLELLDNVEYRTSNPNQLNMLFELDHLATRDRRNAENLIILGGERPGRRWRTPVRLVDLVRGAIAETEHYSRVRLGRMPEVAIVGAVVADLVHLLAELVDNATTYSPPESRVTITGHHGGQAVTVEVVDQGLGIDEPELSRINETLRNPPDFNIDRLTGDSRLGLFVVAALSARHRISVQLSESVYGGIRALVVVPSDLVVYENVTDYHFGVPGLPMSGAQLSDIGIDNRRGHDA